MVSLIKKGILTLTEEESQRMLTDHQQTMPGVKNNFFKNSVQGGNRERGTKKKKKPRLETKGVRS